MSKSVYQLTNISVPFQDQVNVTDLTEDDVRNVPKLNDFINAYTDEIADQFYEKILTVPQLAAIIHQHSSVDKLKRTMRRHLSMMFTKDLNDDYLAERNQIALIHYLIKLEPKWYIAGFQYLFHIITRLLFEKLEDKEEAVNFSSIVSKYISLEMQIVLEAYETKVLTNLEIDDLLEQLDNEGESD